MVCKFGYRIIPLRIFFLANQTRLRPLFVASYTDYRSVVGMERDNPAFSTLPSEFSFRGTATRATKQGRNAAVLHAWPPPRRPDQRQQVSQIQIDVWL